ncbi:hypothetical protein ES705_25372 [subsurface metagenome]
MGKKGKSFWREDSKDKKGNPLKHLYFVISNPDIDNNVLVVNMTTVKNTGREDLSCILDVGDHPEITNKSYIKYDKAIELGTAKMIELAMKKIIILKKGLDPTVLKRIQEGAEKSSALSGKFKKYFSSF